MEIERPSTPPLTPPRHLKPEDRPTMVVNVIGEVEEPTMQTLPEEEDQIEETDRFSGPGYAPIYRAATGEQVPVEGSVAPHTGTEGAPIETAQAAIDVAEELGAIPPLSVTEHGAQIAKEFYGEGYGEGESQERAEKQHLYEERQEMVEGEHKEKRAIPTAEWNVSQRVEASRYDPRVPYVAGFSNGVEMTVCPHCAM